MKNPALKKIAYDLYATGRYTLQDVADLIKVEYKVQRTRQCIWQWIKEYEEYEKS